jgi:GNAT superfamily N-acetyltransferase
VWCPRGPDDHPGTTIGPDATLAQAARYLRQYRLGWLPVVDSGEQVVGISGCSTGSRSSTGPMMRSETKVADEELNESHGKLRARPDVEPFGEGHHASVNRDLHLARVHQQHPSNISRGRCPPAGWSVRVLLLDGTVVRLTELHEADAPRVAAFYRDLPAYDRFLRFFSAGVVPREAHVLGSLGPADVALGAFRGDTLLGVAQSLALGDDPLAAEVALAVAHAEQAHGVGTLLLEHLASLARSRA